MKGIVKIFLFFILFSIYACTHNYKQSHYYSLVLEYQKQMSNDKEYVDALQKLSNNGARTYTDVALFFMADSDMEIFKNSSLCDFKDITNSCLHNLAKTGATVMLLNSFAKADNQKTVDNIYDVWVKNSLSFNRTFSNEDYSKIIKKYNSHAP